MNRWTEPLHAPRRTGCVSASRRAGGDAGRSIALAPICSVSELGTMRDAFPLIGGDVMKTLSD
jgi:hypothetical protein